MTLRFLEYFTAQFGWASDGVCRSQSSSDMRILRIPNVLFVLLSVFVFASAALSQNVRMVIDGSIRSESTKFSSATKIRVLHEDGSIDRTLQFYDPQGYRFGVRLSSNDGFLEDEKILFRVVVTAQDSFLARYSGPPLLFKGTREPFAAPTTRVELFRNSLPTVYRFLRDTTIREGQLLRYIFVAIDRDADAVSFGLRGAPAGATIDSVTGMFSWVPTYDQAGKYVIKFWISDGFETDYSRSAKITVTNVDRPPRFIRELPDTTIKEGDSLRYTIQAEDPDGDKLVYQPYQQIAGIRIDSLQGSIKWVPTYEQAGNYLVRFVVSDGTLGDTSVTAKLTVLNVDRPPIFLSMIADTTISEDQDLQYQCRGTDPDGDSVWYRLKIGPEGLGLSSAGLLAWKPSFTQAGTHKIMLSLRSRDLSADTVMHIRVMNKDRKPESFSLSRPSQNDTVRILLPTPIRFSWSRAADPDPDDTLRYTLRIWGPRLDTLLHSRTDTTLLANIKPYLQPLSLYRWSVSVYDGTFSVPTADTFAIQTSTGITGSTELISEMPKNYNLEQSLPDPFNPTTTIRYALPERSYVKLTIFNMLGESLLVLVSGEKDAGTYDVTFDVGEFASGAYMFRLDAHPLVGNQTKDYVNTKKMIIVR